MCLTYLKAVLLSSKSWTDWRVEQKRTTLGSIRVSAESCTTRISVGTNLLEERYTEKDLIGPVDSKLAMRQQHVLVDQKVSGQFNASCDALKRVCTAGDPPCLFCPSEGSSGVLCPILASSVEIRHGSPGKSPVEGHNDY